MKIIISPTKQMKTELDHFLPESQPTFLTETKQILNALQQLSLAEAQCLWKCSDKLAIENYERIQSMSFNKGTTPSIASYTGLQYQYMAPDLFTEEALDYIQNHLRILSGFYGVLRPFDRIVPYRLEMQAPLAVARKKHLYDFWGQKIYAALDFNRGPVINLASQEYTKTITPYLKPTDQFIEVSFVSLIQGQPKVKATLAKMARGEMVRFMAENQIQTIEGIKKFDHPDYLFSEDLSTDTKIAFINTKDSTS